MTIELRCESSLHAVLSDDHKSIEVRCKRRRCGAERGFIVLHKISLETGEVTKTWRFAEPQERKA